MATKSEVATAKNTEVAGVTDYGDFAGAGFEDTKITDLSIPFLSVMQTNSEIVEEELIEGVKAGDLVNSVTNEIMKQPLVVQPIHKEEVWVEWIPRNKGGGIVDRHDPSSELVKSVLEKNGGSRIPPKDSDGKRPPFKTPSGNDLIETHYIYCYLLDETGLNAEGYCVMAFSSTKIKVQKDWMTSMFTLKGSPPMFANRALVSTVKQKNPDGTFFNFSIRPFKSTWRESLIPTSEEGLALLNDASDFRKMVMDGLAQPDYSSAEKVGGEAPSSADDAPF